MLPEIRSYLDEVGLHLHLDPDTETRAIRELHSYFQEKLRELQESGLSDTDAAKVAIECCGRARQISRRMYEAHSKGSWTEATLALLPHLVFAGLFFSHLWRHPFLATVALSLIICVTLYGWWHGKPSWLYPWIGYSLMPLLIGVYASRPAIVQTASFLSRGHGSLPPIWILLLVCALLVFSVWIIVRTTIRAVRRDWILTSLMLVPLPVVGGWLLNLEQTGGLFQESAAALHVSDMTMAMSLTALGVTSATFIRLRQRVLKVGALLTVGSIALAMIAHNLWGSQVFLGLLVTSFLLVLFLLSPALLEAKIRHGEPRGEHWWENEWCKRPSNTV